LATQGTALTKFIDLSDPSLVPIQEFGWLNVKENKLEVFNTDNQISG